MESKFGKLKIELNCLRSKSDLSDLGYMKYVIELEKGVWFNGFHSDPEKTLIKEHASQFKTKKLAKKALKFARQFRPFKKAKIIAS